MKKVVIAGGSGFIGGRLANHLIAEGYSVSILTRSGTDQKTGANPALIQWDGTNPGPWVDALDGSSAVINLSGSSIGAGRWSASRKKEIVRSRVDSTSALIRGMAAVSVRPGVLVNSSGIGYYGDSGDAAVDEKSPAGSGFLADTVLKWEESASVAADHRIRHVVLRTGLVLGKEAMALQRLVLPFRLFAGGPIGSGKQWVPWVHIDDVVRIMQFAVETDAIFGPVNVCSPEPVRMKEFCDELGRVLHRPSWLPVPSAALRLLLGEMADLILTGQRAVPQVLDAAGYRFRHQSVRSAFENLFIQSNYKGN